jgi:hypothetical protein
VQVCVQELPQSALCHSALALLNSAAVFAQGRARRAAVDGIARLFTRAVELDRATSSCAATLATSPPHPGLYGGSARRAQRARLRKHRPALAQVLRAQVHITRSAGARRGLDRRRGL